MGEVAVVFDWYNTLAAPNQDDFWTRLPELIGAAGGTPNEDALAEWEADHPVDHRAHSVSEKSYRSWQRSRFERLLEASGLGGRARQRLLDEVEQVRYARLFEVFDDVVDVLGALRADGIRVGICSNWDWDLDRHLRHNEIDQLVDFVVCSAIAGYRKPHPAIFEKVQELARLPADQILFVGDNLHDDIHGATSCGLRALHIDRQGSCDRHGHADQAACVPDLESVFAHLG